MEKKPIKEKIKHKVREIKTDVKKKTIAFTYFALAGIGLWLLVQMLYWFFGFSFLEWVKTIPYVTTIFSHLFNEISKSSTLGIFYSLVSSSLFFLPIPLEVLFFNFLKQGVSIFSLFPAALVGIILGQIANYFLGRLFGFIFKKFIKKKTRENIRIRLDKYGFLAVFLVHLLPFPFQIFNLVCGIFKYKYFKWFSFMTFGIVLKHIIMYVIYVKFF